MFGIRGQAQKVPLNLWPAEYKERRKKDGEVRLRMDDAEPTEEGTMDVEEAEGAENSVMKGDITVRWARINDKKQRQVRSALLHLPHFWFCLCQSC